MIYYTVYKVTNEINGKFYIGTHKTSNLDDKYMGSGKYLKYAQEKYGLENFRKEILYIFDTPDKMYKKEAEIVSVDFISEENTYNLKVGGFGGWDFINSNDELRVSKNRYAMQLAQQQGIIEKAIQGCNNARENDPAYDAKRFSKASRTLKEYYSDKPGTFKGRTHTDATKKLISQKVSALQKGKGNSQYGTRWIHSVHERKSKRIGKSDPLPEGWTEGRKMKFI